MNENIDLTKILKDCPKGTKLYTPISGEVYLNRVDCNNDNYPIDVSCDISGNGIDFSFAKDGRYYNEYEDGECILFPSKDQRDWSKFKAPWLKKKKFDPKTLKPFDRVLFTNNNNIWDCAIVSYIKNDIIYFLANSGYVYYCIPYNEETKHLVGTTEEAPEFYRYWEE